MAVLLIAANRTDLESWWNIDVCRGNIVFSNCGCTVDSSKQESCAVLVELFVWRGNNLFRNCGCTVDSRKQDSCGVLVVKYCCVEMQQCVQELWL